MRFGLVARCDDRGLGLIAWEAARALRPDRVLVVREPSAERGGFAPHLERFPRAPVVTFNPVTDALPEDGCRDFLRGLDVVLCLETAYAPGFYDWARAEGVRTVLLTMPEFWRAEPADVVWNPTTWRHDTLPEDARVVPVPVALDRFTPQRGDGRFTWLHVAGKRAARDRNGTDAVAEAMRHLRTPQRLVVATQDGRLPRLRATPRCEVEVRRATPNYWDQYAGVDAMVLPRRYGGLCLPINEAMAAGLAVLGSDREPEASWWPMATVFTRQRGSFPAPGGLLTLDNVDSRALARAMDEMASSPELAEKWRAESQAWAQAHSWEALAPLWRSELERAAAG